MFMTIDQYARQNHNINLGKTFFETVSQFSYMRTSAAVPNCIHKEFKSGAFC